MKYIKLYKTTEEYNKDTDTRNLFPHVLYNGEADILLCESEGNQEIAFTREDNEALFDIAIEQGWVSADATGMTFAECAAVVSIDGVTFSSLTLFDEFQYFTGINEIPEDAFANCSNLETIVLAPYSINKIGDRAFQNCSSLISFVIPESVTEIGEFSFYGCSSLTSVYCENNQVPPTLGFNALPGYDVDYHIYVPCGCEELYKTASGWSDYAGIIEENCNEGDIK